MGLTPRVRGSEMDCEGLQGSQWVILSSIGLLGSALAES